MIPKKKEEYTFVTGAGRPYEVTSRSPIEKTTTEQQKPMVVHLGELNGQDGNKRAPKNFHPKRGRTLGSFCNPDEEGYENAFDIE